MNSPIVTAGGGATLKKNFAWSAGAVKNRSAPPIIAKTPANLGLRNRETKPAIGSRKPTITKNTADAYDRNSLSRVSNPNGVNKSPRRFLPQTTCQYPLYILQRSQFIKQWIHKNYLRTNKLHSLIKALRTYATMNCQIRHNINRAWWDYRGSSPEQ